MHQTIGIIQARLGSTRLKGKLARKVGGKSLLEWVVRRATESHLLDQVVVAAGDGPDDDDIRALVPADVPVFIGSERDVLGRFVAALDAHPAAAVVRICADNLFIDPALIDRLVATAQRHVECDYISYALQNGRPVIQSSLGLFAEWCSAAALRQAAAEAIDPADREHVTRFLYQRPQRFRIRLLPAPTPLDRDDLRLTIDFEEDWDHAVAIFEALGPDALDWQQITGLLDHQPALRRRMAHLNRQHAKV